MTNASTFDISEEEYLAFIGFLKGKIWPTLQFILYTPKSVEGRMIPGRWGVLLYYKTQ